MSSLEKEAWTKIGSLRIALQEFLQCKHKYFKMLNLKKKKIELRYKYTLASNHVVTNKCLNQLKNKYKWVIDYTLKGYYHKRNIKEGC